MKLATGVRSFLLWVFILLFIVVTDTLIYLSTLLDFKDAPQLIFVFSFYLLAYLAALILMVAAWQFLHKLLAAKPLPAQKIKLTYVLTFEEHEKIKAFLSEIRN
ncbi:MULTISPECIES: hypothetical protein [unclassified Pseudomonas]|uniref:hypothetical protein n=1 Tax=unclassified Pseudomonas TaxID=196821 RepID=UPI00191410C0|nr:MULTISPECIES: hypothetical protein [unclassified Pseudomonas]MBK5373835.1 hypothetical protein [Pseudomonas sp. TH43]MBK5512603.1 hypothetical protein [Pseudomonas sp. TH15]